MGVKIVLLKGRSRVRVPPPRCKCVSELFPMILRGTEEEQAVPEPPKPWLKWLAALPTDSDLMPYLEGI